MALTSELYSEQLQVWPKSGRHILAHYDADTVIVYQAYRASIGRYAVEHGLLCGSFSFSRMSWIKPNFLWMMYRSGWGTKEGQEFTLALRLRRAYFDSLLALAIPSSWDRDLFPTKEEWSQAVAHSSVRLQWDPDHDPSGAKVERRAIQLGLRGEVLEAFGRRELVEVQDVSAFVAEQRERLLSGSVSALVTPASGSIAPPTPLLPPGCGWRNRRTPNHLSQPASLRALPERLTPSRLRPAHISGLHEGSIPASPRPAGLPRLRSLEPREPVRRHERQRPGDLMHPDVKQLGQIGGFIGRRVTGDRRHSRRGAGWDHVRLAIDDHSRPAVSWCCATSATTPPTVRPHLRDAAPAPPAHPNLPAADQQQDRTLHPDLDAQIGVLRAPSDLGVAPPDAVAVPPALQPRTLAR